MNSFSGNFSSTDFNFFVATQKTVWIMQLVFTILFLFVIGISIQRLYLMYKKDGTIIFSISSVILIHIIVESLYETIYILIDPDYILGILDNRVALTLLHLPPPVCICNILLIALYWEELLKKSTKATSFLVKYSKFYIVVVILILSLHVVLIILCVVVTDIPTFVTIGYVLDAATIAPASISSLYCIINSIRIVFMIKKMDQKLINKNDRKKKIG